MEDRALVDLVPAREVLAAAELWIGTPWHPGAAVRGTGCDCVGLIRGVLRDVTGRVIPAPPWMPDWASAQAEPLIEAAREWLVPAPPGAAQAGDIVTIRIGHLRAAHAGILTLDGGLIHATERRGVVRVRSLPGKGITTAWRIPAGEV